MSTTKATSIFREVRAELVRRPRFYFALGMSEVLFVWTQDLVPFAGPFLCSLATTLLTAGLFTAERKLKMTPLVWLSMLSFPLNVLWTILAALHQNTTWGESFSTGWSVPAIFFIVFVYVPWARAVKLISVDQIGLDQGLKTAWRESSVEFSSFIWICFLMTVLLSLSFSTMGIGFFVTAPLAFAVMKVTATWPVRERASARSVDHPQP